MPDDFKRDIVSKDWSDVLNEQDPDLSWNLLNARFVSILNQHALYKHFNTGADEKAWITTEFLE